MDWKIFQRMLSTTILADVEVWTGREAVAGEKLRILAIGGSMSEGVVDHQFIRGGYKAFGMAPKDSTSETFHFTMGSLDYLLYKI